MSNKRFAFIVAIAIIAVIFATNIVMVVPSYSINTSYVEILFAQNRVVTIDIAINQNDWNDLKENPLDETMYNITAVIDGEKVSNIGMRTKGNSTLTQLVRDTTSDRYSFKIDFNYYDSANTFYGLTKLNLNNAYQDNSYMKNYLSYKLFKMMGVPYCESSFAYITINGEDWGLYEMIEGIEEPYLIKNFGVENSTGDLYKPDGIGSDLKWIDNNYSSYTGMDLKTNKDLTNNSKLIDFLNAINNSDGSNLEKYLNIDEALKYFAVNIALNNMDSYQGSMKHNYYLYEIDGVFQILPWDYNLAFGGFGGSNISIDNPTNDNLEDRPLLNVLLSNEEYKAKYYEYLEQVANMFIDGTLELMIGEVTQLIEQYVIKDSTKFCTMEEFYVATDITGTYTTANTVKDDKNFEDISQNVQIPPENMAANNKGAFGDNGRGSNMGNTGNVLETAKKLSESILKQLSGEEVVITSSIDRGMNFNDIDDNHKRPEDFNVHGEMQQRQNREDFKMRVDYEQNEEYQKQNYTQSITILVICTIILILLLLFIFNFRKKRIKVQ